MQWTVDGKLWRLNSELADRDAAEKLLQRFIADGVTLPLTPETARSLGLEKHCPKCDKIIPPQPTTGTPYPTRKFCSNPCAQTFRYRSRNPFQTKNCLECGKQFQPEKKADQKFCTYRCQERYRDKMERGNAKKLAKAEQVVYELREKLKKAEVFLASQQKKREDAIADKVIHLKDVEGCSWAQVAMKLNRELGETKSPDRYRSLYRYRKPQ